MASCVRRESEEVDDERSTELHRAVRDGDAALVERLLAEGADPDRPNWEDNGRIPLLEAVARQHLAIVRLLLSSCCLVDAANFQGETALHLAVGAKPPCLDVVFALLNAGADPGIPDKLTGDTCLHTLVARHSSLHDRTERARMLEVLKCLVDQGDVNARNLAHQTALHVAVAASTDDELVAERARVLLEAGADVSSRDGAGQTALHVAADARLPLTARLLIDAGANVNVADRYHMVAMHYAASKNAADVARLLLDSDGCDPNAADHNGDTPLHLAAGKGHVDAVTVLASSSKTDLDATNAFGALALHKAIESGFADVVQVLLDANCGVLAHTGHALTPLDLACTEGIYRARPEISRMLQEAAQNTVDECGVTETDV